MDRQRKEQYFLVRQLGSMYQNKDLQDGVLGGGEEGGKLLEANVTIISNEECKGKEGLDSNKISRQNKLKMLTALPLGLEYGMMCAKGECEDGVCKTSCKVCTILV